MCLSTKVDGSILEATNRFAISFFPSASITPMALPSSIRIFTTLELVIIFPPLDSIYFAIAIGRLTKPPFTTLLPLSCITLAIKRLFLHLQHRQEKGPQMPQKYQT